MINRRYKIVKKLGEGRSLVFLCRDKENADSLLAMKILTKNADLIERESFEKEFFMLQMVDHPDIIKSLESGVVLESSGKHSIETGSPFFTIEYFDGESIFSFPADNEVQLHQLIVKIAGALFYLHQSRIIFYDLKPENILFSLRNNKLEIKLIDFGFAQYSPPDIMQALSGSAEYLAPELLKKEVHDYKVDLYAFGMIVYRLIFKRFPFDTTNELDIYKAQLSEDFDFPPNAFSEETNSIVQGLLMKDPSTRIQNSIDIIERLHPDSIVEVNNTWSPVRRFSNRIDSETILKKYLSGKGSGEIFIVKGSEGSGKSFLLSRLYEANRNAVYINYNGSKTGISFIKDFLNRLYYCEAVFLSLDDIAKVKFRNAIDDNSDLMLDNLRAVFNIISQWADFILLFDDFDRIDDYVFEVIRNILPILQVNNRKVILAENSDSDLSTQIHNVHEISLTPFTEAALSEYLSASYFPLFPIEDLRKIILLHADLLPGNIAAFIKDILLLNAVHYSSEGIILSADKETLRLLESSHEEIYKIRCGLLTEDELEAARIIAAFEAPLEQNFANVIFSKKMHNVKEIINSLYIKNILQSLQMNVLEISSGGLKSYLYKTIPDKKSFHSELAHIITTNLNEFNPVELARQYELAGRFEESFDHLYKEVKEAERIAAYSYGRKLLEKMLQFPVLRDRVNLAQNDLAFFLYHLSAYNDALTVIEELLTGVKADENRELQLLKGSCLIGIGSNESGKNLLLSLTEAMQDSTEKNKVFVEIANAEYELNNYQEATNICESVIEDKYVSDSQKGKCYNLLGLIDIFKENNINKALTNFELAEDTYVTAGMQYRAAQMEMNMGNIYNMRGEHDKAESFWNKSLKIITSIGNLELEAKLLLNYGIYHFDKLNFEQALEFYNRALAIFTSLGNVSGKGLVLYNIGEVHYITCEYSKAIDAVTGSIQIFNRLKNLNEELESLFLLGKTYYSISYVSGLSTVSNTFKEKIQVDKAVDKHKLNCDLIQQLECALTGDLLEVIIRLKALKQQYLAQEDKTNFLFCTHQLLEILYGLEQYHDAINEVDDPSYISISSESPFSANERKYWKGKLLCRNTDTSSAGIELLLEVAEFIQDSSITELSWKTFYTLSKIFHSRGNLLKTEEYAQYAKSVLEFIFENNKGEEIGKIILISPGRAQAYHELSEMEQQ